MPGQGPTESRPAAAAAHGASLRRSCLGPLGRPQHLQARIRQLFTQLFYKHYIPAGILSSTGHSLHCTEHITCQTTKSSAGSIAVTVSTLW